MNSYFTIEHVDPPNPDWDNQVRQGLYRYNREQVGSREFSELSVVLRDDSGQVVGGVVGGTIWGWFLIETLWVADELRGQGYGRQVLERAEAVARERGCRWAVLETFSFQALRFYQAQGYVIYGQLDGFPAGHTRYSLKKELVPPETLPPPDRRPASTAPEAITALRHAPTGDGREAAPQHDYLEALYQVTLELLNRRSLTELLQLIVDRAAAILDAPYAEIMLLEEDALVVRAFTRNQPYLLGDRVRRGEALVTWRAFDTGQPVLIDDYSAWSGRRVIYDEAQLQAVADFPVLIGSTCLGVLAMARVKPDYPFSSEDVQRGIQFSRLAALVLDNTRLYETALHEIAERDAAEKQLRQLSRAVEASPVSIVITDIEGRIEYVNPRFTQVTGYTLAEARGQNPRILKTDRTPAEVHRDLWQTLKAGQEWHGEFCNRKKNGDYYWEFASISPIIDPAGQATHYVAVKEDITERKRLIEELAQARDQALALSRYKTELVAKVSHELRTPLGVILGFAELLYHETFGPLTPKQKHFTTEIRHSANHLNGLISDLLDEAQIERGQIRIQPAPFDPRELVAQVSAVLEPQAQARGLTFSAVVVPDLPAALVGDEKRLRQVLTNLANNAVKFTQAGSVTIRVAPAGDRYWLMQVADTGPGISPETQAQVFESFWQANQPLNLKQGGYGLGLSIVRQLTHLMGGEISLESEVGRGSTFTVTLPLEPPADVTSSVSNDSGPMEETT